MTLEDFFTLTEMKDGLTTLARVEELILAIQKQKELVRANVGDAARQWSTVARTLAITESKECLDHFICLEGLCFLNQWLLDVQKCTNDIGEKIADEVISALLSSLERLPIDREKSSGFGIWMTVELLLGCTNVEIKERARSLVDKWNSMKANAVRCQHLEKGETYQNDELEHTAEAKTRHDGERIDEVPMPSARIEEESKSPNKFLADNVNNVMPTTHPNSTDGQAFLGDTRLLDSSLLSRSCQDDLSYAEARSICRAIGSCSTNMYISPNSKRNDANDQHYVSEFRDAIDCSKEVEVDTKYRKPRDLSCSTNSPVIAAQMDQKEPHLVHNLASIKDGSGKSVTVEAQQNLENINNKRPRYLSGNSSILRKGDSLDGPCDRKDSVKIDQMVDESEKKLSTGVDHVCSIDSTGVGVREGRDISNRSELGLDCEIDALELARQVAIEVEREVVDYREPSCSSPEAHSPEIRDISSPDVREGKQAQPEVNSTDNADTSSSDVVGSRQDLEADLPKECTDTGEPDYAEAMWNQPAVQESEGAKSLNESDILDGEYSAKENSSRTSLEFTDHEEHKQYIELQKSCDVVQESSIKSDRNVCNFDLNEDASTDDLDCTPHTMIHDVVNMPAAVATSKGAPDLPASSSHFEGELGWKVSAATSAFRPTFQRNPHCEKTCSGPHQKSYILDIDLNAKEDEDDMVANQVAVKPAPVSSDLPSGDSSIEVSSRKTERVRLDLNSLGDEDAPSYLSHWRLHQSGNQSPSPASSSSSRQPSMRDFDLNDNPSIFEKDGSSYLNESSFKASGMHGSSKLDEPFITIMGSRVPMEKNDYSNQARQSYSAKGLSLGRTIVARTSLPSVHMPPPAYGYNGLQNEPAMSIPPALYGPGSLPYMVDSRGAPVIPQVLSTTGPNGVPLISRPFLMTVASAPSSSSGVWSSPPALGLTPSMSLVENGRWDSGSSKQSRTQESDVSQEVGVMPTQPGSSGMSLKRKEPDCGWDACGFSYKQVTSWQ